MRSRRALTPRVALPGGRQMALAPELLLGWPRANRPEELEFLLPGIGNIFVFYIPPLAIAHGGFDFARTFDVFAPTLAAAGWRVVVDTKAPKGATAARCTQLGPADAAASCAPGRSRRRSR